MSCHDFIQIRPRRGVPARKVIIIGLKDVLGQVHRPIVARIGTVIKSVIIVLKQSITNVKYIPLALQYAGCQDMT